MPQRRTLFEKTGRAFFAQTYTCLRATFFCAPYGGLQKSKYSQAITPPTVEAKAERAFGRTNAVATSAINLTFACVHTVCRYKIKKEHASACEGRFQFKRAVCKRSRHANTKNLPPNLRKVLLFSFEFTSLCRERLPSF